MSSALKWVAVRLMLGPGHDPGRGMTPICSNTIVYRWSADMHRWFIEVTGELGRIEVHAWDSITPKVSRESLGILGSWRVPVGRRRALAGHPEVFPIHPRTPPIPRQKELA